MILITSSGCQVIPNDNGYPTFHSYWSSESKQYRAERQVGKEQAKEWGAEGDKH